MFSAFQSNAFQNNAFQIVSTVTEIRKGGGGRTYDSNRREWLANRERERLENRRAELQAEIDSNEEKVARIEAERLKDLSDQNLQLQLLIALQVLDGLEREREALNARIAMFMQDEDDLTALLYSLPFMA